MKTPLLGILIFLFTGLTGFSQANQSKTISGIVKDQDGVGLPGVSIAVMGTAQGTVADENGEFTLQAAVGDT